MKRGGEGEGYQAGGQAGGQRAGQADRRRRGEGEVRARVWAGRKHWTREIDTKRRRERQTNVALDPSSDLNIEPPQLMVAPMTEETITLYAAPPPLVMDTGGSRDAEKVRKSIGNQEIAMKEAEIVTEEEEEEEVGVKVMPGQQQIRHRRLYNEDDEEEKQKKRLEEERKRLEAKMRLMKVKEEKKTGNNSSSHQFPSSVRQQSLYENMAS